VIDESGSIKEAEPEKLKTFAKQLVHIFSLGEKATRFSVVSFAANATTRVPWSYSEAEINAGIDGISPDGATSISDGFELARELFLEGGRTGAAKIVLFLSDGDQTVDAKVDSTLSPDGRRRGEQRQGAPRHRVCVGIRTRREQKHTGDDRQ